MREDRRGAEGIIREHKDTRHRALDFRLLVSLDKGVNKHHHLVLQGVRRTTVVERLEVNSPVSCSSYIQALIIVSLTSPGIRVYKGHPLH